MVRTIADAMKFKGRIVFNANQPDGQARKPTSNFRLKNFASDFKFTPFKEGIQKTVDWFVKNYEGCRK